MSVDHGDAAVEGVDGASNACASSTALIEGPPETRAGGGRSAAAGGGAGGGIGGIGGIAGSVDTCMR